MERALPNLTLSALSMAGLTIWPFICAQVTDSLSVNPYIIGFVVFGAVVGVATTFVGRRILRLPAFVSPLVAAPLSVSCALFISVVIFTIGPKQQSGGVFGDLFAAVAVTLLMLGPLIFLTIPVPAILGSLVAIPFTPPFPYQFSMRTFLIATTVLAIVLGLTVLYLRAS